MKTHKFGGACVAIVVVVTMAVAASAQANARSSTAREALAVQGAVERADLVNKLKTALGDAYGGVWYPPTAAQLDVGVTSQDAARIAEAVAVRAGLGSDVVEIAVRSSEAELAETQERLDRRLAGLFAREEVATRADMEENAVYVELGSEVPAGERAALEGAASEALVKVVVTRALRPKLGVELTARCGVLEKTTVGDPPKEQSHAYCDPTIVAGTVLDGTVFNIDKRQRCTTGPAVFSLEKPTETYVLTAGHCVRYDGERFYSYSKAGTEQKVGKVKAFVNSTDADVAAIKVEDDFWTHDGDIPVTPAIAKWDPTQETDPFKVKGETMPVQGAKICGSGQQTGYGCGTITSVDATNQFGVVKLVQVAGSPFDTGDSGGPVFSEAEDKLVQGTLVSRWGDSVYFEPLARSYEQLEKVGAKLKFELLTEANETRHPLQKEKGKGTTAFACVKKFGGTLRGDHCLSTGNAFQESAHEEIKEGTTTEVEGTNEKTAQATFSASEPLLTATVSGVQTEVSCEKETSTGSIKNETAENEKKVKYMRVKGDKIVITFTNCVAKGVLHELGCTIEGGEVKTNELTAETKEATMSVEFKPPAGKSFATFTLLGEKCSLKGAKEVTGTAKAIPERATLRTSTLTTTGMKFGGATASYTSAHTVRMKGGNPISATTTEP